MKTSDVYLGAALLTLGFVLVNIDRSDPRHMIFSFSVPDPKSNLGNVEVEKDKYNLEQVENQWANKHLIGNLFEMGESIKRMKSLIHSS
jgi:hypothetical protein